MKGSFRKSSPTPNLLVCDIKITTPTWPGILGGMQLLLDPTLAPLGGRFQDSDTPGIVSGWHQQWRSDS